MQRATRACNNLSATGSILVERHVMHPFQSIGEEVVDRSTCRQLVSLCLTGGVASVANRTALQLFVQNLVGGAIVGWLPLW